MAKLVVNIEGDNTPKKFENSIWTGDQTRNGVHSGEVISVFVTVNFHFGTSVGRMLSHPSMMPRC